LVFWAWLNSLRVMLANDKISFFSMAE
jgi:hypothetical protein